jgi:hypothetical protein
MGWRRLLLATLGALALAGGAPGLSWAQSAAGTPSAAAGTTAAPELKDALPQARLLGQTRLSVWGFKIYDARLWGLPGFNAQGYASQQVALELAYLRDFAAIDIAERSLKEMGRSGSVSAAQARQWTADMLRVFPNVKAGDRIMGVHRPGAGASFWVNGQRGGEIADAEFARLFFGIWLSPQTSEPAMRAALLGSAAP